MVKLCLIQLLHLYNADSSSYCDDLVVYHLFACRHKLSPALLHVFLCEFIVKGFRPFSPELSEHSKIMMKSIIAVISDKY